MLSFPALFSIRVLRVLRGQCNQMHYPNLLLAVYILLSLISVVFFDRRSHAMTIAKVIRRSQKRCIAGFWLLAYGKEVPFAFRLKLPTPCKLLAD